LYGKLPRKFLDICRENEICSKRAVLFDNFNSISYSVHDIIWELSLNKFYDFNSEYLYLPKYFHHTSIFKQQINKTLRYFNMQYIAPNFYVPPIEGSFKTSLDCKYDLRGEQPRVFEILKNNLNNNGYVYGILQLPTGFGKTFLSLYFANYFKFRTMIIVDNTVLAKQWINKIKEYFNLDESKIGLLYGNVIRLNPNYRFTISLIQTLLAKLRRNDKHILNFIRNIKYDLVIFDECHKITASEKYSKISSIFDTINTLGLSATPFKYSIQRLQMESSVGKIIVSERNDINNLILYFVYYRSELLEKMSGRDRYILRNVLKNQNKMKARNIYLKYLLDSEIYKRLLIDVITKTLTRKEKAIVILSRIEHCKYFADYLETNYPQYKVCRLYGKHELPENINSYDIVIGTYQKCSHGFDMEDATVIIFGAPYTGNISIIQIVGRILRNNDGRPRIIIFPVDRDFISLYDAVKFRTVLERHYGSEKITVKTYDFGAN